MVEVKFAIAVDGSAPSEVAFSYLVELAVKTSDEVTWIPILTRNVL